MAFLNDDDECVCFPSTNGDNLYLDLEVQCEDNNKCVGCASFSVEHNKAFIYNESDDKTIYNIAFCSLCNNCNNVLENVGFINTTDVFEELPNIIKNPGNNTKVIDLNGMKLDTTLLHNNKFTIGSPNNMVNLIETGPKCYQLVCNK